MVDRRKHGAGFSLLEVLVAVMVLGVGLIMVAAVFPVAGNWTRQAAEKNLSQTIAQNALSVIRAKYAAGGQDLVANSPLPGGKVGVLPGLETIPLNQRAYQFGADQPFPAAKPEACTYFWSALARKNPAGDGILDVFILVFHKGDAGQSWASHGGASGEDQEPAQTLPPYMPATAQVDATNVQAFIRPGEFGIGGETGTVFRMVMDGQGNARPQPGLGGDVDVWIAPPADGTGASPLVYVYQTTISY